MMRTHGENAAALTLCIHPSILIMSGAWISINRFEVSDYICCCYFRGKCIVLRAVPRDWRLLQVPTTVVLFPNISIIVV